MWQAGLVALSNVPPVFVCSNSVFPNLTRNAKTKLMQHIGIAMKSGGIKTRSLKTGISVMIPMDGINL
jgi:hypothetical protein